jgi:hypothetical protein
MRKLSDTFLANLTTGFLAPLAELARQDKDLDLEIRDNYLNIYYKGNSLLQLAERTPGHYPLSLHEKFTRGLDLPAALTGAQEVEQYLLAVPGIKDNIIRYAKKSLEIEYEQMIIRANNFEYNNATEYFIIDRQYVSPKIGRFDLTGIYWNRNNRRPGDVVPLCLMEIKFALNKDIQDVDQQLQRYYDAIAADPAALAAEAQLQFHQKLALGLFNQPENRLAAMKTLTISPNPDDIQFILFLIDYNPYSKHLNESKISALPFANQVRLFHGGFALWEIKLKPPQR